MKKTNNTKDKSFKNQEAEKFPKENKHVTDKQNTDEHVDYEKKVKDLNSKILKTTMMIRDHYPELSPYLEEMPVTVPSEDDPEVTLNQLRSYYESLNSLLKKYKDDYSKHKK